MSGSATETLRGANYSKKLNSKILLGLKKTSLIIQEIANTQDQSK